MIKKALKLTLMLVSFSNLLTAEILFDLDAQHFSNVKDGNLEFGRYNLPKVYVSTAAKNYYGMYSEKDFNVEIKNPPASWSVTFNLDAHTNVTSKLSFVSDKGKTISVTFKDGKIIFDGYEQSLSNMYIDVSGTLTKEGNQVTLYVNGYYKRTATVSNFSKLKFVKIPMGHFDYMIGLTIGSSN